MIARFPNFSPIGLRHKEEYEEIIKDFPPYSDFNFVSLFCWNSNQTTEISRLGEGIVIKLKDYTSDNIIYSFLSKDKETLKMVKKILDLSPRLCLVPESTINAMGPHDLDICEEPDNFDYVYKLLDLVSLDGKKYKKKRNKVHRFNTDLSSDVTTQVVRDIAPSLRQEIEGVVVQWCFENEVLVADMQDEVDAILAAVDNLKALNLILVEVRVKGKLKGFSINEITHGTYSLCHFEKTINAHENIASYLVKSVADILLTKGSHFVNWEQDLGLDGLRQLKRSYHQDHFLKKYSLSYAKTNKGKYL